LDADAVQPSPIFLTYSIVVCGIPAIAAGASFASTNGCPGQFMVFLGGMIAVNVALIGFAVYFYNQFAKPYTGQDEGGRRETGVMSRASNMFCYDPVVFVYLLALGAGIVLAILGISWSSSCEASAKSNAALVMSMFWLYIFGGIAVISLSLCVECGRTSGVTVQHAQQGAPAAVHKMTVMQRLFFPRSNMPTAQAVHVPYAQPAPPPGHPQPAFVNPPYTHNTQLPQAQVRLCGIACSLRLPSHLRACPPNAYTELRYLHLPHAPHSSVGERHVSRWSPVSCGMPGARRLADKRVGA
jgi:hypothetical protein